MCVRLYYTIIIYPIGYEEKGGRDFFYRTDAMTLSRSASSIIGANNSSVNSHGQHPVRIGKTNKILINLLWSFRCWWCRISACAALSLARDIMRWLSIVLVISKIYKHSYRMNSVMYQAPYRGYPRTHICSISLCKSFFFVLFNSALVSLLYLSISISYHYIYRVDIVQLCPKYIIRHRRAVVLRSPCALQLNRPMHRCYLLNFVLLY